MKTVESSVVVKAVDPSVVTKTVPDSRGGVGLPRRSMPMFKPSCGVKRWHNVIDGRSFGGRGTPFGIVALRGIAEKATQGFRRFYLRKILRRAHRRRANRRTCHHVVSALVHEAVHAALRFLWLLWHGWLGSYLFLCHIFGDVASQRRREVLHLLRIRETFLDGVGKKKCFCGTTERSLNAFLR